VLETVALDAILAFLFELRHYQLMDALARARTPR
jgi:hypothetical protein